jgi:hypothetical protein
MLQWFFRTRKRSGGPSGVEAILNDGLYLAMEWGKHWLQPIQERLARKHPHLSPVKLDEVNATCQEAMRFGHSTVYDLVERHGRDVGFERFEPIMRAKYAWVSDSNLSRLYSQGMYYSMK